MVKISTNHTAFFVKCVLLICIQVVSTISYAQDVTVKQLKVGKSKENVFASDYFSGKIYYCSDKINKSKKRVENEYDQNFLDLFSVGYDFETMHLEEEENLGENINTLLNEGPISIDSKSRVGYFSSNRVDTSTSDLFLTLFQSELSQDNKFKERTEIFKELEGFNIAHPAISENGEVLVFSSDNPESKGQTDLYLSVLNNSEWTSPIAISNLNTVAIETFPHFYGNTLYFSSDREGSLGGLDIFKCIFRNDQFSDPQRLDAPINSEFDDFLYIPINETQGLLSSNRNGSKDKIYQYKIDLPMPSEFIEVNDNFCYDLADEGNIDSTRFKHTWSTGDGTILHGQNVRHCYGDTGTFFISCDLLDSRTGKKDVAFISAEINIEINTPTIQTEVKNSLLKLTIDQTYSEVVYNEYYWIVDNNIYTDPSPSVPIRSGEIEVKLIVWEEKKSDSAVGILKKITLKP